MIWHTPMNATTLQEQLETQSHVGYFNFSPWDFLKYENLSYDQIINFIWEISYGETLESILSEKQVDDVIEFLVFLTRNGVRDDDVYGKTTLEEDIKWLRGELNESDLDEEDERSWFFSALNDYQNCTIFPALIKGSEKPNIILCKGWIGKKWKQTKKFVKKHKKAIIIAAAVVVAAIIIVATGGAARRADQSSPSTPHINKPGEVKFQEDLSPPSPTETAQNESVNAGPYRPQLEPTPKLSYPLDEVIAQQSSEIKEALSEQIPDDETNTSHAEEQSFWLQTKTTVKESGSRIAHNLVDGVTNFAETCGTFGSICFDDYEPKRPPISEFISNDVIPFGDDLHQIIDEKFGTNYAEQYGSAARNASPPETMGDLLKDLGKNVAFCFVPVPGSQLNKVSKVCKNAKIIYELAKAAKVIQGTAAIGSALTATSSIPSTSQDLTPVPREQGNITVYQSFDPLTNEVQYVGITNDAIRRQREHWNEKGIKIYEIDGLTALTRSDAKAVEQCLIEIHGLEKNGGNLINRINSIAETNPEYAQSLIRGAEILKEAGLVE